MDCRKEAINDLKRYRQQKAGIENLKSKIDLLKSKEQNLSDKAEIVKLTTALKYAEDVVKITDRGLEALPKDERGLIFDYYSMGMTRYELQEKYAIEHSQFYRMTDKAVKHLAVALYGMEEI